MRYENGAIVRLSMKNPNILEEYRGLTALVIRCVEPDKMMHYLPKWECLLLEKGIKMLLYDFQLKDAKLLCR
jgi:hypothetical protein